MSQKMGTRAPQSCRPPRHDKLNQILLETLLVPVQVYSALCSKSSMLIPPNLVLPPSEKNMDDSKISLAPSLRATLHEICFYLLFVDPNHTCVYMV